MLRFKQLLTRVLLYYAAVGVWCHFSYVYTGFNKEEPELTINTEENQDEEPSKAKKRKLVMFLTYC